MYPPQSAGRQIPVHRRRYVGNDFLRVPKAELGVFHQHGYADLRRGLVGNGLQLAAQRVARLAGQADKG